MLGLKTYIKKNLSYPKFLFPKKNNIFPEKPTAKLKINARIFALVNKLKEQKKTINIANLLSYPHESAVTAWKKLLPYNPNNLGNWSIKEIIPDLETAAVERELIFKLLDLYKYHGRDVEGYVTSGATEANLFTCWTGREYLQKKIRGLGKICLLKTNLTHYSIRKSCHITQIKEYIVPLDKKIWGMDIVGLEQLINKRYKNGYRGFLIPLTLGYTTTGTIDPIFKVIELTKKMKKKLPIDFFVWVDGALNGFIEPFLNPDFKPFFHKEIQSFVVDLHKFGFSPYPAGIVLYRKELRQLIEKPIDYLEEKDNTILGSRTGISAVACWSTIMSLGKEGFRKRINEYMASKKLFIDLIENSFSKVEVITHERSLTVGIVFSSLHGSKLTAKIEKKYGLYPSKIKIISSKGKDTKTIYKFFFLASVSNKNIKEFIKDILENNVKH